jgi:DNA repair exonuclease SbcCD ATPase subunit
MRRLRPFNATAAKCFLAQVTFVVVVTLLLCAAGNAAQQPSVGKQKAPKLTTDDVSRPPAEQPSVESKEAPKSEDAGKTVAAEPKTSQPKATETKVSEEESSWRDRVKKARDRAKELERNAEQAELRITALRNDLGVSGQSARYRNEVAGELDQAGEQLKDLRSQAREAANDLAQLVEYGQQKGFTEGGEPNPTEDGKPNEQYYRAQFAKLTEASESAQRRIQLYDNRVRDLTQRLMTNSGGRDKSGKPTGGDNFYNAQLQQDLEEAQQKLGEARAALLKAQTDLDTLRDEARRAGVPPGVFR